MKKIVTILICFLLLFGSMPVQAASNSKSDNNMPVVVSLGDSYSSGEGVQPYYGQDSTDKYTCEDWIAHRSTYAWPGLLQYNGKSLNTVRAANPSVLDGLTVDYESCKDNGSWYFTAVSGAVTQDVISMQYTDEKGNSQYSYGQIKEVETPDNIIPTLYHKNDYKLNLQVDTVVSVQEKQDIDYITMTIGGNDVGFSDIMIKAATSSYIDMGGFVNQLLTVIENFWNKNSYGDRIKFTYEKLLEVAPSATLVIAGYPQLLHEKEDETGVGGLFNYTECCLINDAVYIFNNYIQTIVNGFSDRVVFVDVQNNFATHGAYSEDPYIYGIELVTSQEIHYSSLFDAISKGSFHPNEKGVQAYADTVQKALAKIDPGFADTYYNIKSELEVYDINGELYDDYTIKINGKEYKDIIGTFDFWGLWKQDYIKTFKVSKSEPFSLELPKGNYTITVTDNSDETKTISKPIKIRNGNKNTTIQLTSNFGNSNESYNSNSKTNYDAILQIFLSAKEYLSYIDNLASSKLEYVIYDINSDDIPELLMQSTDEAPFYTTWIFAIDNGKVILVDEHYGYGKYRYSEKYNMLLVSPETKPFSGTGTTPFYSLEQNNLIYKFQVGEDLGEIFYSDNSGERVITAEDKTSYLENVIDFTWLKIDDFVVTQAIQSSTERDIVLVLDVSGSMAGTPMEETKKASNNFISTILKENASIGLVAYDDSATMLSNFSTNEAVLKSITNFIDDGGGTNIESGLQMAESMLSASSAEKKIIVLMSDGQPNEGKVGDALIAYADSIKDEGIYIYTLGFFESMGSSKSSAQILMEEIASDGCHYEVADADNLVFFFGDVADQINGQKYIYVRIACPVDVTVTYDGETLCSVEDDLNTRTNFGTLTFEDNEEEAEDSSDNRIKVLRLKDGTDYDIKIDGNGRGRMNYTIGFMDETGEYSDLRKFTNIRISKRTQIDTVATNSSSTILNVDEDGDGKYDLKYKAKANGRGEIVDYTYLIYISIGAVVLIAILIVYIKFKKRSKNKNKT